MTQEILAKVNEFINLLKTLKSAQSIANNEVKEYKYLETKIELINQKLNKSDFDKEKEDLETFKKTLNLEELRIIKAIMYSGRCVCGESEYPEKYISLNEQVNYVKSLREDIDTLYYSMIVKAPLVIYLEKGIEYHYSELIAA